MGVGGKSFKQNGGVLSVKSCGFPGGSVVKNHLLMQEMRV